MRSFVVYEYFWLFVFSVIGHEWVLQYWYFVDMSEYFGTSSLWT
jgi:hypothetical protein